MVTLTEAGAQMMKSGGSLRLNWPSSVVSPVRDSGGGGGGEVRLAEVGFDEGLYRKLRECRTAMAAREGVPAYVIFNNQTLEFLTRLRPQTMAEGLRVRGIGEGKAKRYLEPFLEILRQHR